MKSISDLDELCDFIRSFTKKYPKHSENIDAELLISHIRDLESIIGNDKLKIRIGSCVKKILVKKLMKTKTTPYMSFALLGSPGIGKTTIGSKIANIWSSAGFLSKGHSPPVRNFEINPTVIIENRAVYISSAIIAFIVAVIIGKLASASKMGKKSVIATAVVSFIIIYTLIVYFRGGFNLEVKKNTEGEQEEKQELITDRRTFTMTETNDLISSFYGKTPEQIDSYMDRNRGVVMLYDEAYDLVEAGNYHYGKIALTHMVKRMSEDPQGCVFGFMGYEDDIKSLLSEQDGLPRRVPYIFICEGYTSDELFKILLQQLIGAKIQISERDLGKCKSMFDEVYQQLTDYGGDTKVIVDECETILCDRWDVNSDPELSVVTYEIFKEAVETRLREKLSQKDLKNRKKARRDPFGGHTMSLG